jgi:hypothetical protein
VSVPGTLLSGDWPQPVAVTAINNKTPNNAIWLSKENFIIHSFVESAYRKTFEREKTELTESLFPQFSPVRKTTFENSLAVRACIYGVLADSWLSALVA